MEDIHLLNDIWTLWYHNPSDNNWSIDSYSKLMNIKSIEDYWVLNKNLEHKIIESSMLFIMREGINPMWEDPNNIDGGCWSFKFQKNNIGKIWNNFIINLLGENFLNIEDKKIINGISLSPKKNFCILKIWFKNKDHQKINIFKKIDEINYEGSIFKSHK